eukprot:Tbor_TRINITY_DN2622_c0_g1::TRINITY_DN2622_c0_g1_i1::g.17989::m.17989/K15109/SLC25A20_29, CACT, CACL, CRC1; solute carrier family 25 (mitochondrial carnitine/acylcarnitine transporter), member 20/29
MGDFLAGWCGGVSVLIVCHPFDTLKVRVQGASFDTRNWRTVSGSVKQPCDLVTKDTWQTLTTIYKKEGVIAFYRGMVSPIAGVGLATAAQFGVYGQVSDFIARKKYREHYERTWLEGHLQNVVELSIFDKVISATCGGIAYAATIAPFELVKVRLQTQVLFTHRKYFGSFDCGKKVYREGGLRKLYRGLYVTLLRDIIGSVVYFGLYGYIRQVLPQSENKLNIASTLLAGGCAGVGQWSVVFPLDTIKTRYQIAKEGTYIDWIHCARVIYRNEGFKAFYYGVTPSLIRAFVGNAVCFIGVEAALRVMKKEREYEE